MENSFQRYTKQRVPVGREEQDGSRAGGCEIWKMDFMRCPFCGHGSATVSAEYIGHCSWWPTFIPLKCNFWFQWWGPVNVAVITIAGKSFLSRQCWVCFFLSLHTSEKDFLQCTYAVFETSSTTLTLYHSIVVHSYSLQTSNICFSHVDALLILPLP